MNRRWLVKRTNPEYIRYISKAVSISPAFAQVLINRGIKTPQQINDFLNPDLSGLSDPFELTGVKEAVERIRHAISRNERVLVSGDYDADGLTATAIMVYTLRMHGLDVHYFIPNRMTHGYGFNPASIKAAKELGAALIITVDCGITAFDTVSYAKQEGIDVIITDHHEPKVADSSKLIAHSNEPRATNDEPNFLIPDALAVINPKLSTPNSKLRTMNYDLSGAGVAFKIAQALDLSLATRHSPLLFDLAAIGTMADVVPVTGENRIIVREGMKLIKEGQRHGIRALKSIAGLEGREISAGLLSFILIPRINAAGRIDDSRDVVRLLLSDIYEDAVDLSSWLDKLNSKRQGIEEDVYQEALERLHSRGFDSVIVLSGENWHQGVLGIVASRLAEEFYRPAFIFSVQDGIAKGSARSIPSFDLCRGLSECKDMLLSFGGHKQAAGVKLKIENIQTFEDAMSAVIKNSLRDDDLVSTLEIDADIQLSEVNHNLIKELERLEPFGCGNEEPFFASKKLEPVNPRIVGNNHLKMRLKQGYQSIDAIGFDMAALGGSLRRGDINPASFIDVVFTPIINEYNGSSHLQLNIKAFRPSR